MRRFILIDQSITGEGGHYLTYARAVLDSAKKEGFLPVLCVNRRFSLEAGLSYRVYPAFDYTALESMSTFRLGSFIGNGNKWRYLWGGLVKPAVQRAARMVLGIHYRDIRAKILPPSASLSEQSLELDYKASSFSRDFLALVSELSLSTEDIVFFPTLSIVELQGLEEALRTVEWMHLPPIHVLFRWNPFRGKRRDYNRELQTLHYTRERFCSCEDLRMLRFYTDSGRLAEQYNEFSRCRFSVLPIPHTEYATSNFRHDKKAWVISYLGDARPEKGFLYLPEIVDMLSDENVRFQIQANFNIPGGEGGVASCRRKLRKKKNVTLYETALNEEKYASALARTDIMLILYDPEQYYARSSGIFAEAMAEGIPALVPADTWMSVEVCKGRYARLRLIAEQFQQKKSSLRVDNGTFCWEWGNGFATRVILRFSMNWAHSGDSVRIETVMESECGQKIKQTIDFVERGEDHDCFAILTIPEGCKVMRGCLKGTYGQTVPEICEAEVIELSARAPSFGGICAIFDSYDQCGPLLKNMLKEYSVLRESAEAFARNWSAFHNPQSFIEKMLYKAREKF